MSRAAGAGICIAALAPLAAQKVTVAAKRPARINVLNIQKAPRPCRFVSRLVLVGPQPTNVTVRKATPR
ncbi:protein of unknown function [Bradyrhizobium vignae]|uniref:Uncharacterized protein n=1 Tax=Bradyrhizobium vignae TaxID=1549949 RepID=A0A2U3Q8G8_9BRAD|nr:protein of unknown function [Bradyrhizobium vignae]